MNKAKENGKITGFLKEFKILKKQMLTAFASNATDNSGIADGTASELANLIQIFFSKLPLWIAALIVLLISFILAKIVRNIVENKLAEKGIEEEHKELQILGGRVSYVVILVLGATIALKMAGIDVTAIIAAMALGIGFAFRDLLMNFLAGMMILIGRHFSIGDFIKVNNTMGKVKEIQSRVTILQAIDGTKVIVPNSDLLNKEVTSFTSNPFRRIEILVNVDYREDLKKVSEICMNLLKNNKGIIQEPKPAVIIDQFAENSVTIKLRAWVESRGGWVKIKSKINLELKQTFDAEGIRIPFPVRTIIQDDGNPKEKNPELPQATEQQDSTDPTEQTAVFTPTA